MLHSATDTPEFDRWLDDFFASYYRHRPVNATFIGVHDYDANLPDYSETGWPIRSRTCSPCCSGSSSFLQSRCPARKG